MTESIQALPAFPDRGDPKGAVTGLPDYGAGVIGHFQRRAQVVAVVPGRFLKADFHIFNYPNDNLISLTYQ